MTLEELRQRLIAERQREDEERANLIRQNDDLREKNLRLHEQRSRSVTRSRSRTSRSSSIQSRSNRRNARREQTLDNIDENLQEDDNLQDQRNERHTVNDRYEQPHERRRRQEDQRNNRLQDATERHRTRYASDNDGEHDPEQGRIILHGRQMLSMFDGSTCAVQHIKAYSRSLLQWEENDAVLCKYFPSRLTGEALQWFEGLPVGTIISFRHLQNVFLGQYISNNMSRPGIETAFGLRRRVNEILRHLTTRWRTMCSEMERRVDERFFILAFVNALFPTDLLYTQIFRIKDTITMSELREFQEEYIALEEKQRDMESYPVAMPNANTGNAILLPRMTNVVASTTQGNQGKKNTEMETGSHG
ncbi:uncharacterized protein LOC113360728 [Papaver somniferum]|uniref:uncharacterized protein LOC113360728 n=1 Tax=Papaver somniferum TaxID=3469 RepID=UPI000E703CD7|nr:uncharacterized protein LOC113360728 [Papaver somniferum]